MTINPKSSLSWGRALLVLPIVAGLASCSDRNPIGPEPVGPHPSATSLDAPVEQGCARFEVRLSGKDRIQVVPDVSIHCGHVQPVLGEEPVFDVTRKLVRLPVALENRGPHGLRAPARLYGWEDSLAVASPRGLSGNRHNSTLLEFVSPDSTGSEPRASLVWRYDEQLPGVGSARALAAGQRSGLRWIEISVHPGVEAFGVMFRSSARRASSPVPATAPDTIPGDLYGNPDQILNDSPYFSLSDKVLKNIVSVRFEDGASQAARQAAVDLVGGELVGGQPFPGMEGYYLIRVEDEGAGRQMSEAIDLLNVTPGVAVAEPEYLFDHGERAQWLKPKEDGAWSIDWQLDPAKADGKNWALEAISAPLAWECNTGDSRTRIAVLDVGFLSHPDLTPNISYSVDLDRYEGLYRKNDHGTGVASIIAAKGNNGQGISGVMWDAGLLLMEDSKKGISEFGDVVRAIRARFLGPMPDIKVQRMMMHQALASGAGVVNISSGAVGVSKKTHIPLQRRIDAIMKDVNEMKYILEKSSNKALVVVAAGNEAGVDAAWSGYPILATELPDQVIAVGAVSGVAADYATLWPSSAVNARNSPFPAKHHDLIQIYAPGENVAVLGEGWMSDWAISSGNGTSFAAPMVTGVAGLLKSFDPSLTSKEIKDLLIRGAQKGGRIVVGGGDGTQGFTVNAYESLKLAAQRPGAPLCGNRMWASNGAVVAERGAGTETLFQVGEPVWEVNALHGGRDVRIMHPRSYRSFRYQPGLNGGTWGEVPDTHTVDWPEGTSGATYSFSDYSHDGTLRVSEHLTATNDNLAIRLTLTDVRTRVESPITTINIPKPVASEIGFCMREFLDLVPEDLPSDWMPEWSEWRKLQKEQIYKLRQDSTCHFFGRYSPEARRTPVVGLSAGAMSPMGDTYLLVVNYQTTRQWVVSNPCVSKVLLYRARESRSVEVTVKYQCRDRRDQVETSGAEIYSVPLVTGAAWKLRPELSESEANVWNVLISEDGSEWSAAHTVGREDSSAGFRWNFERWQWENYYPLHAFSRACDTRFRSTHTGAVQKTVQACDGYGDFTSTFSPSLIPGSRPGPARPPAAPPGRKPRPSAVGRGVAWERAARP